MPFSAIASLTALVFNFDDLEHVGRSHVAFNLYKTTGDHSAMFPNSRAEINGDGCAIGIQQTCGGHAVAQCAVEFIACRSFIH